MTKARLGLLVLVAIGVGLFFATTVRAEPPGGEGEGEKTSLAPSKANKPAKHGWLFECTTPSGGPNTTLDCDDPFPNNEPNIVVDPTNPQHLISSSNDYGSCCDQYYTTFNAGATWSTGNMSVEDSSRTGSDPVTSFDVKHHVALHSSLNYTFNDEGETCDGDVVVSPSHDGGLSWQKPVVVYSGQGCDLDPTQIFNDKEWITTDNNPSSKFYGRTYVTWTRVRLAQRRVRVVGDLGVAQRRRRPLLVEGEGDLGIEPRDLHFQEDGPAGVCDEDQFSNPGRRTRRHGLRRLREQPEHGPLGARRGRRRPVLDRQVHRRWRDLVEPALRGGPRGRLARLSDQRRRPPDADRVPGSRQLGRQHRRRRERGGLPRLRRQPQRHPRHREPGHEHRHLRDELGERRHHVDEPGARRHGRRRPVVPVDRREPAQRADRGPLPRSRCLQRPDLQHRARRGRARVAGEDVLSTAPSNPTLSEFFQAGIPTCEFCALFHGDYIGLAYGSDGHANATWTDMRVPSPFTPGLFLQFIDYARK